MSVVFNLNVLLGNHIQNNTIYWSKNTRNCKFSTEAVVQPDPWKKSCHSSVWSIWRSNHNIRIVYEVIHHPRCRTWNKLWLYFIFTIQFMSVTWSENVSRYLMLNKCTYSNYNFSQLLCRWLMNNDNLQKLFPFLNLNNSLRRAGVIMTIKNCCFELGNFLSKLQDLIFYSTLVIYFIFV